jgi:DNA repair exonuclease SbcCD ATPase subunit
MNIMWIKASVVAALVAALTLLGTAASAQSLGALAKQEEARRKSVKSPGKLYTNENLRPDTSSPSEPATPAAPAADSTQPTPGASPATPPKEDDKSAADAQKKDEAYWKDRLAQARTALDRSKTFAEALQSRINALTTDFSARSDPAQRAQIERDRQKALAELDRVQQEIKDNTKAITDIQEEARKAGVPAGWVR